MQEFLKQKQTFKITGKEQLSNNYLEFNHILLSGELGFREERL